MKTELEQKDWIDKAEIAKQVIRNAKLDLLVWQPVLEQCMRELKKFPEVKEK